MTMTVPRGRTYYSNMSWELEFEDIRKTNLSGLLERLLRDGDQDHSMWTKTILSRGLNILDHILAGGEVDEGVRAELLQTHLPLLLTRIDGNGSETHSLSVLLRERTQPTTSTNDGHSLTRPCT